MIHNLKIKKKYFDPVLNGVKMFELRKNDRKYEVGDILILQESLDGETSENPRVVKREITYILEGGEYGLDSEYVILSLSPYLEKIC